LGRAFRWRRLLDTGAYTTIEEIATAESINPSYVGRVQCMTLLAPDLVEVALELFILAAGMDFPEAMLAAGAMLQSGDGVAVDHVEALKWHLLAAGHHDSDAELRALARGAISLLDGKLSPEGRAEARARAAAWTPD